MVPSHSIPWNMKLKFFYSYPIPWEGKCSLDRPVPHGTFGHRSSHLDDFFVPSRLTKSPGKRRTKEIFDMKRCTCHLQIIYIESLHLLTITVESLCMYNRHTKEMRKRIKKNICLIYHLIFIKSVDISNRYFVELNFFPPKIFKCKWNLQSTCQQLI